MLEGIVLKPNMVIPGLNCTQQSSVDEVAEYTYNCLRETVPHQVPGCAFLSGGQSCEDATANLNMLNAKYIDVRCGPIFKTIWKSSAQDKLLTVVR